MNDLTGKQLSILAGAGSALLLAAAFAFQIAGYIPCELCILQRWPHLIAALIAVAIWRWGARRWLVMLGLISMAVALGLAVYHSGVEWLWWPGPSACTGGVGDLANMTTQDLMTRLQQAPVVRCDEPALRILGASMANMNAAASAVLAVIWLWALRKQA